MKTGSRLLSVIIVFLLSVVLLFATGTWAFAAGEQALSAEAMNNFKAQVKLLHKEKRSLTGVQRKINPSITRHLHVKVLQDRKETLPKL
jgi:high-affinity K+ transport system ATPase subunit B